MCSLEDVETTTAASGGSHSVDNHPAHLKYVIFAVFNSHYRKLFSIFLFRPEAKEPSSAQHEHQRDEDEANNMQVDPPGISVEQSETLDDYRNRLEALRANYDKLEDELRSTQKKLEKARNKNDKLKTAYDELASKNDKLEDKLDDLMDDLKQAREAYEESEKDVAAAEKEISRNKARMLAVICLLSCFFLFLFFFSKLFTTECTFHNRYQRTAEWY
jgi:archaellum component FlaC